MPADHRGNRTDTDAPAVNLTAHTGGYCVKLGAAGSPGVRTRGPPWYVRYGIPVPVVPAAIGHTYGTRSANLHVLVEGGPI